MGITVILVFILVTVVGQLIVTKVVGREKIAEYHEVGGHYMSIVGTFYSVLLGLIVYDAMGRFESAKQYVEDEANALMIIYSLSDRLPNESREPIKGLVKEYIDEVISHEWLTMDEGRKSEKARATLFDLLKQIRLIEPQTENQKAIYPTILNCILEAWENRRARINYAEFGIPSVEWTVLLAGGFITVVFTYFFTLQDQAVQTAMTAMVALVISMSLYLVFLFGEPFSGDLRVTTNSFFLVQKLIAENP